MTKEPSIQNIIEQADRIKINHVTAVGSYDHSESVSESYEEKLCFTESELSSLLEQVQREQREICQLIFDSLVDGTAEDGEHLTHSTISGVSERIRNAPPAWRKS